MSASHNAALSLKSSNKTVLAAAYTPKSVNRTDTSTVIGGYSNFDPTNRFTYYQQLGKCTPHASISLKKLGLSLVKGMQFDGKAQAAKEFDRWAKKVNLVEQLSTIARLLSRDGIYAATPIGRTPETFSLVPMLMPATTLLPAGIKKGDKNPGTIMKPAVAEFVANEGDKKNEVTLKPEQVIYGTCDAWDSVQKDIMDRDTFGIYGASLMDPIELSIRNLLNINSGYVSFVKKYGNGRYHFDFKLLEKLVEQEIIDLTAAQNAIDDFLEKNKYLGENEDIAAVGLSVVPIDAKGSLNVMEFKKSLETDIQLGLLQTPLTMGDSKGSTYAAGYVSEEDRLVVLEGLQQVVQNIANDAINKRLALMNKTPDSVWVEFEELSRPKLEAGDVQEMYNTGAITKEQFLEWAGFQVEGE